MEHIKNDLSITVSDYSEKAVAIFGDTKEIKEELKEIKARYNKHLKKNGETVNGWVYPKAKKDLLLDMLKKIGFNAKAEPSPTQPEEKKLETNTPLFS